MNLPDELKKRMQQRMEQHQKSVFADQKTLSRWIVTALWDVQKECDLEFDKEFEKRLKTLEPKFLLENPHVRELVDRLSWYKERLIFKYAESPNLDYHIKTGEILNKWRGDEQS